MRASSEGMSPPRMRRGGARRSRLALATARSPTVYPLACAPSRYLWLRLRSSASHHKRARARSAIPKRGCCRLRLRTPHAAGARAGLFFSHSDPEAPRRSLARRRPRAAEPSCSATAPALHSQLRRSGEHCFLARCPCLALDAHRAPHPGRLRPLPPTATRWFRPRCRA
jgi:hypothetical protein